MLRFELLRAPPRRQQGRGGAVSEQPILQVNGLSHRFGRRVAVADVDFELWPGEVLGIVGESGAGKTTLLRCLSGQLAPSAGRVGYGDRLGKMVDVYALSEAGRRMLLRTDWGIVHQNAADGLRMGVSAGGNIGERLMAVGDRHYGNIRGQALDWLQRVEMDIGRIDDLPATFSGGMQQ